MFRKFALAIAATAALGAAALSPTAASAHWHGGHHWGHGFRVGFYGPTFVAAPDCYRVKRLVQFDDGSWHKRWFTVCN